MAGQGTLSIGAVFDKNGVDTGLTDVAAVAKSTMDSIATFAEQAHARTRNAFKGLSDDVKAAAESVSAESLKVAEATKAQAAALADLRRARVIANDSTVDAATATSILAAAQHKAVLSSEELAEAKKAEASAVSEGAEEIALSSNAIVAGFQRAGAAVAESLAGMRERMVLTAEGAHLSARDITGAFSGLGELLGIGMLADFGGEYLQGLSEMQVELGHLAVTTGMSVTNLAGLREVVKGMGAEWEPVQRGLVRMNKAMAEAQEGMVEYKRAFVDIGVSMDQLKGKKPEEQLQIIANAFAHTDNAARTADAALTLFGRGGIELIPVLKEQGNALTENMGKYGKLTGVTDDTVAASRRWIEETTSLARDIRHVVIPAIEYMEDVISGIVGGFEAAAFVVVEGCNVIGEALISAGQAAYGFGKLLFDALHNPTAIVGDMQHMQAQIATGWKSTFGDIEAGWKEVVSRFKAPAPLPELIGVNPGDLSPPPKHTRTAKGSPIKADEDELVKLERVHALTVQEEADFWNKKLTAADRGSQLYAEILRKLAPLERQLKEQQKALQPQQDKGNLNAAEDAFIAANNAQVRSSQQAMQKTIEAYRSARQEEMRLAAEHYQEIERDSEFEVRMGRMTAQERIAILRQASLQEQQIRIQALHAIEMADMLDPQRWQQDMNREVEETRRAMLQIKQLNQQAALQTEQVWKQAFDKMTNELNQNIARWVEQGRGFSQSMATMMNGITENFVKNVAKMAEQYLIGLMMQKAGQKQQIVADAKTAAANTYSAVSAIPVVGPFLAPPAAAAAFAGVMAFESFSEGGIVGGGSHGMAVPVLAHAGERVLSAQQTQNFESLVNNNNSSRGGDQFHLHYNGQVNAFDRTGMRSTLKSHAGDILDIVREGWRDGKLA